MHKDEMWQLYYPNGEPILEKGWDSANDTPRTDDDIIGVVVIFLCRFKDGELELLWQKRSEKVSFYAGDWDFAAGGHINLGETGVEAATRELKEEIGVDVSAEELKYVTMTSYGKNRLGWLYVVDWTGREDSFGFSDGEVSEVKWIKYNDMERFRKENAKEPLKNDDLTFLLLGKWLETHGYLSRKQHKELKNYAFIDGNNLYLGTKNQGIKLDYRKLRLYLKNKLQVEKALLFIGYDKSRRELYNMLKRSGFELVFKPAVFYTSKSGNKMMKGNVDAELVLYSAAVEFDNYDQAVVITGDGDFACLMEYLKRNNKLAKIITPTAFFSLLLKPYIRDILPIKFIKDRIQKNGGK